MGDELVQLQFVRGEAVKGMVAKSEARLVPAETSARVTDSVVAAQGLLIVSCDMIQSYLQAEAILRGKS